MSSTKGRSGNKKGNHPRKHRRKRNLEKRWRLKSMEEKKRSTYSPRINRYMHHLLEYSSSNISKILKPYT